MADVVYLDSCIFIELIQRSDDDRLQCCEALWELAKKKELTIVTSSISIVEVNKDPEKASLSAKDSQSILDFFEHDCITIRPADRFTCEYAHKLVRSYGLYPVDAMHVATAILSKSSVLYTYDGDGKKSRRRKSLLKYNGMIGNPAIKIEIPPDPLKGSLLGWKNKTKQSAAEDLGQGISMTGSD